MSHNRNMVDRTRSLVSLAAPLVGPGPRFDPGDGVNQEVVNALVDNANPSTPSAPAPQRPASMSNAEYEQLKSLAADLFNPDPEIGSAALKKMAKLTGQEDQLAALMAPRQPEQPVQQPVHGSGAQASPDDGYDDAVGDMALDFYTDYLNRGIREVMGGRDMHTLKEAAKRLKGDKFDEAKWLKDVQARVENEVVKEFRYLSASGQKIQGKTLDKVLSKAQDDIIGLIRSTIGDPTGIGRHASAQAPLPGSDIPEERTRLPSLQEARKDPIAALAAASEANKADFARRLAALRAGQDGTNA